MILLIISCFRIRQEMGIPPPQTHSVVFHAFAGLSAPCKAIHLLWLVPNIYLSLSSSPDMGRVCWGVGDSLDELFALHCPQEACALCFKFS
jgi:hypothetical protein